MTPDMAVDYIQSVLKDMSYDERFKLNRPVVVPDDQDCIRAFLDFTGNGPPFSTSAATFRISEMTRLGQRELDQYIEQELRNAEQELRDFVEARGQGEAMQR